MVKNKMSRISPFIFTININGLILFISTQRYLVLLKKNCWPKKTAAWEAWNNYGKFLSEGIQKKTTLASLYNYISFNKRYALGT